MSVSARMVPIILSMFLAASPASSTLPTTLPARTHATKKATNEAPTRALRLVRNGSALQKVLFVKLYRVTLYLENPTTDATEALRSEQAKRLRLKVLRSVSRERIADALVSGFERSAPGPEQSRALAPKLSQLIDGLRDVRANEEITFTYVPDHGTLIEQAGHAPLLVTGKPFADALFGIWLGENTDVPHVRRALLEGARKRVAVLTKN